MKAEFLEGNRLTLLETGGDFFPALIAAIDARAAEFHLETYIFEDDASGAGRRGALARRPHARRVGPRAGGRLRRGDFPATLRWRRRRAGA
jgi:cardiolipin synthase